MRRSILILVLAVACSPASVAESPSRGGFANGICQPTTRTDDMGIITATGSFGLLGPVRASADDSLNDEIRSRGTTCSGVELRIHFGKILDLKIEVDVVETGTRSADRLG